MNLMIDLETLDTAPSAAMLSIGIVPFLFIGENVEIYDPLHIGVSPESCFKHGLTISDDTLMFWIMQSEKARNYIASLHRLDLETAIVTVNRYCETNYPKTGSRKNSMVYSNPDGFDIAILSYAYSRVSQKLPWEHYNVLDYRTLASLDRSIKNSHPRSGVHHNAVDDCIYQIEVLNKVRLHYKLDL